MANNNRNDMNPYDRHDRQYRGDRNIDRDYDKTYSSGTNYGSGSNYDSNSNSYSRSSGTRMDRDYNKNPDYQDAGNYSSFGRDNYNQTMDNEERSYGQIGHSGKGPKGWRRSDENIREQVCDRLEMDSHIDASEIEVTVKDGIVTLTGKVETRKMKRHSEDIIEHVAGVKDVKNDLSVEQGFFQQMKDAVMGESSPGSKSSTKSTSSRH